MSGAGPIRGWRAIADHLGRSVRTVQRWEDQHALPVAREGDSVVANPEELDRWLRSWARYGALPDGELPQGELSVRQPPDGLVVDNDETAAPGPRTGVAPTATRTDELAETGTPGRPPEATGPAFPVPPRTGLRVPRLVARLGLLLLLAGPAAAYTWLRTTSGTGQPASWRIAGRTVFVNDSSGRLLFSHPLGAGRPQVFTHDPRYPLTWQWVVFADLEGDGRLEVLVRTPPDGREHGRVSCLDADGRLRFTVQASGSKRFGRNDYGEPWYCKALVPTVGADGTRSLWVMWIHNTWFPSRIQRIGTDGEVLAEYWSNGHVFSVEEARLGGRDLVFVGATYNESRNGSLAVFENDGVRGSAPATRPEYRCEDCGEGGPLEFLVFPSSCIWQRLTRGGARVVGTSADTGGLSVLVLGGETVQAGRELTATLTYRFSPQLELEHVRLQPDFVRLHAMLFGRAVLDHPLTPADAHDLQPVRRWDGSRFVELPRVPIVR